MTVESLRTPQAPGNAPFRPLQGAGGGPQGVSTASKPTGCARGGGLRPPALRAPTLRTHLPPAPLHPCIPAPSKIYAKEAAAHAAEQMP